MEQSIKDWQDIKGILHYQSLFYVPEIICTKLISRYYNDLLAGHFSIEKIQKLVI